MVEVVVWSLLQLGLFWTLVRLCIRVLGFRPSAKLFKAPDRMVLPSIAHAAITAGTAFLLQQVLGLRRFARPVWFSSADGGAIAACMALALTPDNTYQLPVIDYRSFSRLSTRS
jgi:hypothetical protein